MAAKTEHKAPLDERECAETVEVLEKGAIHFFYRPRVGLDKVQGIQDVQRLYILLSTNSTHRLLIVPRKRLPDVTKKGQVGWAFVDAVSKSTEEVVQILDKAHYQTKTRGQRVLGGARVLGRGQYMLVLHREVQSEHHTVVHTHLTYVLDHPEHATAVQHAFNVHTTADFILQVKNPKKSSPSYITHSHHVDYSRHLQESFQGISKENRFASTNLPEFLDIPGGELLIIASHHEVHESLGTEVDSEVSELAEDASNAMSIGDIKSELHLWHRHKAILTGPLEGKWV